MDCDVLRIAYDAFNARDIDSALATMHPDVDWPNGMEGGYVHGHREVREYCQITDDLADFDDDAPGWIDVEAQRLDVGIDDGPLAGRITADRIVQHVYQMRDQLITSMEIRARPT